MIKKQYSKIKPVCKVTFSLSAEEIGKNAKVRVLGQFNDWNWEKGLVLKKRKEQYNASLELTAGQSYEFRYLVDGGAWGNDPAADAYTTTPFSSQNSVVVLDEVKIAPKAKKAAPKKKVVKAKVVAKKVVAKKTATKKTTADDLKKIEGVGPKIAGLLIADGIKSFLDLSKAKNTKLKAILEAAGSRYKMHDPTTWPQQAKLAANGEWSKLQTLQDELKGGKKK